MRTMETSVCASCGDLSSVPFISTRWGLVFFRDDIVSLFFFFCFFFVFFFFVFFFFLLKFRGYTFKGDTSVKLYLPLFWKKVCPKSKDFLPFKVSFQKEIGVHQKKKGSPKSGRSAGCIYVAWSSAPANKYYSSKKWCTTLYGLLNHLLYNAIK